jgi:hypothetical protein
LEDFKQEHPRFTKYVSFVLSMSGILLVLHIVGDLVDYSTAAQKYIQQTTPYVDAVAHGKTTPRDEKLRLQLQKIFAEKLSKEEFQENIDAINRALQPSPAPVSSEERMDFMMEMGFLRQKMDRHEVPNHPGKLIVLGCVLFFLGTLLEAKPAAAPAPPPPDKPPWQDAPIPPLGTPSTPQDPAWRNR